jgi:membrane associated rhomboid family serine protease
MRSRPWLDVQPEGLRDLPAAGWEVPAGGDGSFADLRSAAAAIAGESAQQTLWIRRPGELQAIPVSEEPELRLAVADRDRRRGRQLLKDQWTLTVPWIGMALLSFRSTAGMAVLVLTVVLMQPVLATIDHVRRVRLWRSDPSRAAAAMALEIRVATWIGRRSGPGKWPMAVAGVVAVTSVATWFAGSRGLHSIAVDPAAILAGDWWRLATGTVVHGHPAHLLFNLMAWLALADTVARYCGRNVPVPCLGLGMVVGAAGTVAWHSGTPSVGMSGGCCALIGLLAAGWWRWRESPPPGLGRMAVVNAGMLLLLSVVGSAVVDHAAHLGGVLAGICLGIAIIPQDPGRLVEHRGWRWATWGATAGLVAAAVAAGCLAWR